MDNYIIIIIIKCVRPTADELRELATDEMRFNMVLLYTCIDINIDVDVDVEG